MTFPISSAHNAKLQALNWNEFIKMCTHTKRSVAENGRWRGISYLHLLYLEGKNEARQSDEWCRVSKRLKDWWLHSQWEGNGRVHVAPWDSLRHSTAEREWDRAADRGWPQKMVVRKGGIWSKLTSSHGEVCDGARRSAWTSFESSRSAYGFESQPLQKQTDDYAMIQRLRDWTDLLKKFLCSSFMGNCGFVTKKGPGWHNG